ncbi:MAG: 3-oxoacyl-[acyl-carrier-protein] synthase 3 [Planctomycetota bacterium]
MKSKSEHSAGFGPQGLLTGLRITAAVSLADSPGYFEPLGNTEVLGLSRQGGRPGFRDLATIRRLTGVESRRLLQPGITPLMLVQGLDECLHRRAGLSLRSCDAVLLCHSQADPAATAALAAAVAADPGLGLKHFSGANFGCTGFVQLLCEAAELFLEQPGMQRIALLNVETPEFWHCSADRVFCGIVGAGATAVLVERCGSDANATGSDTPATPAHSTLGWELRGLGRADFPVPLTADSEPLFTAETTAAFSFRGAAVSRCVMRMQAEAVFVNGIELMLLALRLALRAQPARPDQRLLVLPHQPSGKLLRAFAVAAQQEFCGCRILENLEHHGNTISCTIPQQLSELADVCRRNAVAPPTRDDLLIAVTTGICMSRKHDQMSCGYALLTLC